MKEGDQWKLTSKGETTWGRVESNGQLEVNGTGYENPSKAYMAVLGKKETAGTTATMARTMSIITLTCYVVCIENGSNGRPLQRSRPPESQIVPLAEEAVLFL